MAAAIVRRFSQPHNHHPHAVEHNEPNRTKAAIRATMYGLLQRKELSMEEEEQLHHLREELKSLEHQTAETAKMQMLPKSASLNQITPAVSAPLGYNCAHEDSVLHLSGPSPPSNTTPGSIPGKVHPRDAWQRGITFVRRNNTTRRFIRLIQESMADKQHLYDEKSKIRSELYALRQKKHLNANDEQHVQSLIARLRELDALTRHSSQMTIRVVTG